MKRRFQNQLALTVLAASVAVGCGASGSDTKTVAAGNVDPDTALIEAVAESYALAAQGKLPASDSLTRYTSLSDEDFRIVAEQLNVEIAAIKAVVEIEAGKSMKGFWAPGVPIINFDPTMFAKYRNKGPGMTTAVPSGLSGYALREWTQLVKARKTSCNGADMGTFWGMFQIGGFNYKLCGCSTVREFIELMSNSEFDQLELFAVFIMKTGMVNDLRTRNWASFSRKYNGPGYAKRGYHTRMAAAYNKYKKAG